MNFMLRRALSASMSRRIVFDVNVRPPCDPRCRRMARQQHATQMQIALFI
jgi:hypothetical protein